MNPRTRRHCLAAAVATFVALAATGCASEEDPDVYTHCVDSETGEVVDDSQCTCTDKHVEIDDDGDVTDEHRHGCYLYGHSYMYWVDTTHHKRGYKIPKKHLAEYRKNFINPKDPAARAKANLPKTGLIKSGTKISGSGLGKGGAPVSQGG